MKQPSNLTEASMLWIDAQNRYAEKRRLATEANIAEAQARQEMKIAHMVYEDFYGEIINPKVGV